MEFGTKAEISVSGSGGGSGGGSGSRSSTIGVACVGHRRRERRGGMGLEILRGDGGYITNCEDWESLVHEARFFDVAFEQPRVPAVASAQRGKNRKSARVNQVHYVHIICVVPVEGWAPKSICSRSGP
jgi:hypothetical protein